MILFMFDFDEFINYIKSKDYYSGQICHIEHIPELKARYNNLNKPLKRRLGR